MWKRVLLLGLLWLPGLALAQSGERLSALLRLPEILTIIQDEGLRHGESLDAEMLNGTGGPAWARAVAQIYDVAQMEAELVAQFDTDLSAAQVAEIAEFFESARGQLILQLETTARQAMADPSIEEGARDAAAERRAAPGDAQLQAIEGFISVNDLLERNVVGALRATYHFYRGLVAGEVMQMDEAMMLETVRAQKDEIRADTEGWLYGFLLMAYRPLSVEDIEAYADFSESAVGQAMNAALFAGFDALFDRISYEMGLGVGRARQSQEL